MHFSHGGISNVGRVLAWVHFPVLSATDASRGEQGGSEGESGWEEDERTDVPKGNKYGRTKRGKARVEERAGT